MGHDDGETDADEKEDLTECAAKHLAAFLGTCRAQEMTASSMHGSRKAMGITHFFPRTQLCLPLPLPQHPHVYLREAFLQGL